MRLIYSLQLELEPTTPGTSLMLIAPLTRGGMTRHAWPTKRGLRMIDLVPGDWIRHQGTRYRIRGVQEYRQHAVDAAFVASYPQTLAGYVVPE